MSPDASGKATWALPSGLPADVYDVTVRMDPNNGYYQAQPTAPSALAVYDPSGVATGGGWIVDGGQQGVIAFGAKYVGRQESLQGDFAYVYGPLKGITRVVGNSLQWLVVKDHTAILRGKATVNGTANYSFEMTVVDNPGLLSKDSFALKLWKPDETLLRGLPAAPLGFGDIVVLHSLPGLKPAATTTTAAASPTAPLKSAAVAPDPTATATPSATPSATKSPAPTGTPTPTATSGGSPTATGTARFPQAAPATTTPAPSATPTSAASSTPASRGRKGGVGSPATGAEVARPALESAILLFAPRGMVNTMARERPAYQDRIVCDPEVMVSKPVVKGTRIPVELVLQHLEENPDLQDLFAAFPRLTREDVSACLAYARSVLESDRCDAPRHRTTAASAGRA